MLSMLLVSAAILAAPSTQTPATPESPAPVKVKTTRVKIGKAQKAQAEKGPALEGWVYTQTGKPLGATVGLIPMSKHNGSLALKSVESRPVASKKKPAFKLPLPKAGLYILDVRASKHEPLQVPVLLTEEGLKDLKFMPRPEKPKGEVKPISEDPKMARMESLYSAFKGREQKYRKAIRQMEKMDWTADVEQVGKELQAETDADAQSMLAMSYLSLGNMLAKLDKAVAGMALDKLPANSPWWALGNYAGVGFSAADRNADYNAFREALAKENPDAEVRAFAMAAQLASYSRKGDMEKMRSVYNALTTEYKDTAAARSAKQFNPEKMLTNGKPFPAFQLKDVDGKDITLDTFKGKTVLVDFWATWCRPCVNEVPTLEAAYAKYKDNGFDILSISLDKTAGDVMTFRADASHPMAWKHVFLGRDSKNPILSAVSLTLIPRPILVGPDGRILEAAPEKLAGSYLMETLDKVMAAAGVSAPAAPAPVQAPAAPAEVPAAEAPAEPKVN